MANTSSPTDLDIAEQVSRILRSNEETQKFVAEQRKLLVEQAKLQAEAARFERDRSMSVCQVAVSCLAACAALFGAGAAFIKVLGPSRLLKKSLAGLSWR